MTKKENQLFKWLPLVTPIVLASGIVASFAVNNYRLGWLEETVITYKRDLASELDKVSIALDRNAEDLNALELKTSERLSKVAIDMADIRGDIRLILRLLREASVDHNDLDQL